MGFTYAQIGVDKYVQVSFVRIDPSIWVSSTSCAADNNAANTLFIVAQWVKNNNSYGLNNCKFNRASTPGNPNNISAYPKVLYIIA